MVKTFSQQIKSLNDQNSVPIQSGTSNMRWTKSSVSFRNSAYVELEKYTCIGKTINGTTKDPFVNLQLLDQ